MKIHELKTDDRVFLAVTSGAKKYEIRKHDRPFEVGDMMLLRETQHTGKEMAEHGYVLLYTGREYIAPITHILRGPIYGLAVGWSILSIGQGHFQAVGGSDK